jgi:exodeoxyribonuclease V alpha subunit
MATEFTFSRLDQAFAEFLAQRSGFTLDRRAAFKQVIARLSFAQSQGHSCLRLTAAEQAFLQASALVTRVEASNCLAKITHNPLILNKNYLYTPRYWHYEARLAQQLKHLLTCHYTIPTLDTALDRYFPASTAAIDWQREAAKLALTQAFAMITGGPGTGKTTTVVKILALLQELAPQPLYIALAAPTGKAAMRLQESIGLNKQTLRCAEAVKQQIPETVQTLHRLLGAKPPSPYFRHDRDNPLPYDVIVIDEASMVDLALMSKVVDALKTGTRLILLGDKDQLASVEAGSVLADLTRALPQQTVELQKSHRFQGQIKALATAVNQQQAAVAWQVLTEGGEQVSLFQGNLIAYIAKQQEAYLALIKQAVDFKELFACFTRFQVLCANRQGTNSVQQINELVEKQLTASGRIQRTSQWYSGRPVMITQNHAALQLYNGDIGICLPDKNHYNRLLVFFLRPDGSVKTVLPTRLPPCETVFAMTIHKSQGSEFDEVMIVLPDKMNPVLTKELIYTAITRAKHTVKIAAACEIFSLALAQKIVRYSGLPDKLTPDLEEK